MPPNSFIQCEDPAFQTKIIVREGNPEFEFYTELRAPFQDALKLKVFHRAYNKDHQAELYRNQMIGECTLNLKQHILDFRQAKDLIDHTLRKKVRIVIGSTEQYVGYKALATTNQLQPQLDAEIDICQGETFPEEPSHPGAEEPSLEINEQLIQNFHKAMQAIDEESHQKEPNYDSTRGNEALRASSQDVISHFLNTQKQQSPTLASYLPSTAVDYRAQIPAEDNLTGLQDALKGIDTIHDQIKKWQDTSRDNDLVAAMQQGQ